MGHQNMIGGTRHRVERGRYDTGGGTAAEFGSRVERLTTDARGGARARQHAGARLSCLCPLRGFEFVRHPCNATRVEGAVALTQTQLATAVADRAQLRKADANGRPLVWPGVRR